MILDQFGLFEEITGVIHPDAAFNIAFGNGDGEGVADEKDGCR